MKVTITSFSYKRGLPEDKTGNGGGFVFDCRAMPNPFWDESLRGYTGRDKPIADFLALHKDKADRFLGAAETLVRQSIDEYLKDDREHLQVAFDCTGGQHRSVFFAERMAERLAGIEGVGIEVTHTVRQHWKVKTKEKCYGELSTTQIVSMGERMEATRKSPPLKQRFLTRCNRRAVRDAVCVI